MRLLIFLLGVVPVLAFGQSDSKRTCRILFLSAPPEAPQTLQLFDGTTSREVELPRMNLSPVYDLPAGPLVLRMLQVAPDKPELVNPDAPKVTLGEKITDFYLLVSSDPENKVAPVRLQVINASSTDFKKGEMLWFNLTPNSVGGKVGSEKLAMKPNSKVILKAPASGNEDYPVNLTFMMPGNERLYPLCETKWLHDPRSRSILFIFAQKGSRTPRVMGFPDYREEEKKASGQAE